MTEKRESGFKTNPDYRITFERSPRRVRVKFNGETIVDSTNAHLLFETRHLPVYYFPQADIRMDRLTATPHRTYCPYKGDASYWDVTAGGKSAANAAWSYRDPFAEVAAIKDYIAFYWNLMEAWYEEDDEIFVHPRDPYKRVDVVNSSRAVRVVLGGETVAATKRARFLFETRLPTRYYIPIEDVRASCWCRAPSSRNVPIRAKRATTRSGSASASTRTSSGPIPIRSPNARRSRTISASSTSMSTPSSSTASRSRGR